MTAIPKPEARKKEKARAKREDAKELKTVRQVVFEQDKTCRFPEHGRHLFPCGPAGANDQLAHLDERKRARTTGRLPRFRHDVEHCMRLCIRHHSGYDGSLGVGKTFTIQYLTTRKARGRCRFLQTGSGTWLVDN